MKTRKADKSAGDLRVRKGCQKLRDAHALGRKILAACPTDEKTYGKYAIARAAARHTVNPDTARKLRAFAHPIRGYTAEDLDALCDLLGETRHVIGFTFVAKFLSIPNRAKRAAFQRQAIEGRWSLAKVEVELVKQFGRRRRAGRKPRILAKLPDFLAELETRAIYWRRLEETLKEQPEEGRDRICWSDLPENVRRLLLGATTALGKLERAAGSCLGKVRRSGRRVPRSASRRRGKQRASRFRK